MFPRLLTRMVEVDTIALRARMAWLQLLLLLPLRDCSLVGVRPVRLPLTPHHLCLLLSPTTENRALAAAGLHGITGTLLFAGQI